MRAKEDIIHRLRRTRKASNIQNTRAALKKTSRVCYPPFASVSFDFRRLKPVCKTFRESVLPEA